MRTWTWFGKLLAVSAIALVTSAGAQERRQSIVFVDLDRAFNEYYKTRLADAQLKSQAKEFDDELKKMLADGEKLQKDFNAIREEAQNPALNDEVRAAKRTIAEEKVMAIREQEGKVQRFKELRSKQLDEQTRRMRKGLVGEIRDLVKIHAREKGYDAVVDASGSSLNGVETVLYVDAKVDITADILALLNKGAPKDAAPAAAAPAAKK